MQQKDTMEKKTASSACFISPVSYLKRKTVCRFTLIELLVKITCFSGDLAKAHEV